LIINKIYIRNFRNIKEIEYEPYRKLNIFLGDNAQGKTNLLEAVFVLATGSSFRTKQNVNLIKHEENSFNIRSTYIFNKRLIKSRFDYYKCGNKTFEINNKRTNHNNKEHLRIVLFTPDDLYLIKGNPLKRRNFLDFTLKQISKEYAYKLNNYSKILKKRNLLFKNDQANSKIFKIVEDLFIENAAQLILARINFISIIDNLALSIFKQINNENNFIKMKYALSFPINSDKINSGVIKDKLNEQVKVKREKEINHKRSLIGPHLDDVHIYIDNRMARLFASQGQQRNIIISLKLAEIYTIKKLFGFYPVFLLDEVLSELDDNKQRLLMNYLINAEFQSFLTTVNLKHNINNQISIIKNGYLERKGH
jgi:DNA replication and repair protein RecF